MIESAAWAFWTRTAIIDAAHAWALEHGHPPGAIDWRRAEPSHPADSAVRRIFGTWNTMISECGWEPRGAHRPAMWTREATQQALFEWTYRHGRHPRFKDWQKVSPSRPTAQQVIKMYGSWNAMLVAGGYTPRVMYRTTVGYQRQAGAHAR